VPEPHNRASKLVRVAALCLNQTPLDFRGNLGRILVGLDEARRMGATLVCAPELCVSGYGSEDAFLWPSVSAHSLETLAQVIPATRGLVFALGLPLRFEERLYNVVALIADGALLGFAGKRHLAGDGVHYEPRWFTPWPRGLSTEWVGDLSGFGRIVVPIGDYVFDVGGLRIGFEICEDAWVTERPGAELGGSRVDVILNPSASHFGFGKHAYRRTLVETGSSEFDCAYVYANLLGNEAGRCIYDGDGLIADGGRVVASGERFRFSDHNLVVHDLPIRVHDRPAAGARPAVACQFDWPNLPPATDPPRAPSVGLGLLAKEEEFGRAVALGLFDYARKSRSRGYVVSLSGGADSAACALLVRLMVRLAIETRGLVQVQKDLGQGDVETESELMRRVLTTAYQSTAHSGSVTRSAAKNLALALFAEHHEFDVEPIVQNYRALGEQALGRPLEFPGDDIALQNLQARARAPSVWLLANTKNALLVSTSNRSEAAVGYATMDGDTAGGLAPIAGIDKHYLRSWLVFMQAEGLAELGPTAALGAVNVQTPTAELRPPEYLQTDEADLMPYDVLNAAEAAFVVARGAPRDVLRALEDQFPEYDKKSLVQWTRRFFELFSRNQWKRERYAPSFHLDDRSLDPKSWCRFPILSGGFASDLEDL
jgi:NAD+ synthase (glutamine-hydrolysing)